MDSRNSVFFRERMIDRGHVYSVNIGNKYESDAENILVWQFCILLDKKYLRKKM